MLLEVTLKTVKDLDNLDVGKSGVYYIGNLPNAKHMAEFAREILRRSTALFYRLEGVGSNNEKSRYNYACTGELELKQYKLTKDEIQRLNMPYDFAYAYIAKRVKTYGKKNTKLPHQVAWMEW